MMFPHIAILGAGTIGMSWAALFAASGRQVTIFDPAPDVEKRCVAFFADVAPALTALGWKNAGDLSDVHFTDDPVHAVKNADFIQENAPERLEVKHALYARIEPHLKLGAILGSSTSGWKLSELQRGFSDPSCLILAHPFNPPHLIPLVELMANDLTRQNALESAQSFYEGLGKTCVRLNKEIPGHIANRIQAAVWRETIHLAIEGVASIEDIDKAISAGPGLRWAVMGPNMLFHLGGGPGGIRNFCEHLGGPFASWWSNLGTPDLTTEVADRLESGIRSSIRETSHVEMCKQRDAAILDVLKSRPLR
jgi:carnitine 3-dehydrogenase